MLFLLFSSYRMVILYLTYRFVRKLLQIFKVFVDKLYNFIIRRQITFFGIQLLHDLIKSERLSSFKRTLQAPRLFLARNQSFTQTERFLLFRQFSFCFQNATRCNICFMVVHIIAYSTTPFMFLKKFNTIIIFTSMFLRVLV